MMLSSGCQGKSFNPPPPWELDIWIFLWIKSECQRCSIFKPHISIMLWVSKTSLSYSRIYCFCSKWLKGTGSLFAPSWHFKCRNQLLSFTVSGLWLDAGIEVEKWSLISPYLFSKNWMLSIYLAFYLEIEDSQRQTFCSFLFLPGQVKLGIKTWETSDWNLGK